MFHRILQNVIEKRDNKHKAVIVLGARQVGKTTLIKQILQQKEYLLLDGDNPMVRDLLYNPNTEEIKDIIGHYKIVFIDEAQRINNIGISLKIIIDQLRDVDVYVTGSSAFYLQNEINEALTGRKWEYELYPLCWEEFEHHEGYLQSLQQLDNVLIYGMYPEVRNRRGDERFVLNQLTGSYLYKDIYEFSGIRKPEILQKLLKALAYQIGSEVKYNELAQLVGVDKETIARYIQILEQAYVIFRLPPFSRNLRNEIKRNQKVYFYDNGIRNALIGNFTPFKLREDKGVLWENFLISERLKQNKYKERYTQMYFWRTKQQQEVDLVEVFDGKITGFEFKWKTKKNTKLPKTFTHTYKANEIIVDKNNFRDFVWIK